MHPIPIRHGMTVGEIALMINGEGWIKSDNKVDLKVIKINQLKFIDLKILILLNLQQKLMHWIMTQWIV